jgi:subtilisin family serine protease
VNRSEDAKSADKWFAELQLTHNLLGGRALTNQPVKIALLDSGIDGRHPFLYPKPFGKGWGARIRGWLDFDTHGKELIQHDSDWTTWIKSALWSDDKDLYQPYQDRDGHGTHCAGLILRVAPHAHLYVARVGAGRSCDPDPEIVAKVQYPSDLLY